MWCLEAAAMQELGLHMQKCFHSVPLKHWDLPKNADPKGLLQLEVFQKSLFICCSLQEAFLYELKISLWFFKCHFSACVRLTFIAINL